MGYIRVDKELMENGAVVDILNDGSLFLKLRSARSKAVEAERQKQQAPYRNILLAGRPLPVGISHEIGQKIVVNAMIVGVAGTLPDGSSHGRIVDGKPVEFSKPDAAVLKANLDEAPDLEDDISTAAGVSATFERAAVSDANGDPAPSTVEAVQDAAGNS